MSSGPLAQRLEQAFDSLGPQLQAAARFVLDEPGDVALLSMRQQAKRAGVQPHTMTRLAQRIGLSGYEDVRALYGASLKEGSLGFSEKAGRHVASQKERGDRALAAEMAQTIGAQVMAFAEPATLDRLAGAADLLVSSERIYCLGLRSCHSVMSHFAYVLSFLGERAVMLDAAAGTGLDRLWSATPADVLVVVSVEPYLRITIETARRAAARGIPLIAITDRLTSPLSAIARETILVPTESPSFYHGIAPAFVAAEILAALVAGRGGQASLSAIEGTERRMSELGLHWQPGPASRSNPRRET